jgi:hypothetical protein
MEFGAAPVLPGIRAAVAVQYSYKANNRSALPPQTWALSSAEIGRSRMKSTPARRCSNGGHLDAEPEGGSREAVAEGAEFRDHGGCRMQVDRHPEFLGLGKERPVPRLVEI